MRRYLYLNLPRAKNEISLGEEKSFGATQVENIFI